MEDEFNPCIGICEYDPETGICLGCGRLPDGSQPPSLAPEPAQGAGISPSPPSDEASK